MGILLEKTLEKKKFLIDQLISRGIYKKNNIHLYELRLRELEEEYLKTQIQENKEIMDGDMHVGYR